MENNDGCLWIILELCFTIWILCTIDDIQDINQEQQKELNSLKYRLDLIEGIKQKETIWPKDTSYYEVQVYSPKDTIKKYNL